MVSIGKAISLAADCLKEKYSNPRLEAEILAEYVLGKDRLFLIIHSNDEISEFMLSQLNSCVQRRLSGEPSAYITGKKEFMSLSFNVSPSVLIPRPETELLVEKAIDEIGEKKAYILDICTGSGAIACCVAYYLKNVFVTGVDISEEALFLAEKNKFATNTESKVSFFKKDALKKIDLGKKFDLVLSNPPYIETETIETLSDGVKNFEPRIALDGGKDGLIFYRKIVDNIESILLPGGKLMFEIGYNQGKEVADIMSKKFSGIEIIKDYAGNDRIACGQLE